MIEKIDSINGFLIYLYFNEEHHKYTDNLNNLYTSCTTLLHKYQKPFDKAYWARRKAKEEGVSIKAITAKWETITEVACIRGSNKHDGLEKNIKQNSKFINAVKYLKDSSTGGITRMLTVSDLEVLDSSVGELNIEEFRTKVGNKYPDIFKVIEFYQSKGYKFYAEIGVFLYKYLISGMIDLLALNPNTKEFVIIDWKTNKDGLKFKSGYFKKDSNKVVTNEWVDKDDRLLAPVNNLHDCNGSIYTLQLSMYAKMVEHYGYKCKGLVLMHIVDQFILNEYGMPLKGKDGLYTVDETKPEVVTRYVVNYLSKECDAILNDHMITKNINHLTQANLFINEQDFVE